MQSGQSPLLQQHLSSMQVSATAATDAEWAESPAATAEATTDAEWAESPDATASQQHAV